MITKIVLITRKVCNITPRTTSKDSRLEDCSTMTQKSTTCSGGTAYMLNNTINEGRSIVDLDEKPCKNVWCVPLFRNKSKLQDRFKHIGLLSDHVVSIENREWWPVQIVFEEAYRWEYEVGKATGRVNGQHQWDCYECLVLHVQSYNKKGGNCRCRFFPEWWRSVVQLLVQG